VTFIMVNGIKGGLIVKRMKLMWVVVLLLLAVVLTSCGVAAPQPALDANAIYTSVAGTMIAQLNVHQTQTAQALPPTPFSSPTPLDTFTPQPTLPVIPTVTPFTINTPAGIVLPTLSTGNGTPGSTSAVGCDDSIFVSESAPNNGEQFKAGTQFSKSFTFQNTGTCTWVNNYALGFQSGDRMSAKDTQISNRVNFTLPGNIHTFTLNLVAPHGKGHYVGVWAVENGIGKAFGSRVWVDIVVK
jgi:hypothetical protein